MTNFGIGVILSSWTKRAHHLESSQIPLIPQEGRAVYPEAYRVMAKNKAFRLERDEG